MKKLLFILIGVMYFSDNYGQKNYWQLNSEENLHFTEKTERTSKISDYEIYSLDFEGLKETLKLAPSRINNNTSNVIVSFPNEMGEFDNYRIFEASVMHPELALKHENIQSYVGIGVNNPNSTIRFSTTIFGLHTMSFSADSGTTYIDPYTKDLKNYIVYNKQNVSTDLPFYCHVKDSDEDFVNEEAFYAPRSIQNGQGIFRTYRLAVACTTEYATYHINAAGLQNASLQQKSAAVLAAMNVMMTRVNGIYERDMSLTMQLIPQNESIIFITSDNFNNNSASQLINQSQTVIDSIIGFSNYDIGHTVSTGGGGLAQLNSPCGYSKARGITGSPAPVGDPFFVDYVAHEMGHQFGATHTFNNSCQNNREAITAVEPGSGSTILGYAGICPPNVQNNSDAYFHVRSLQQMDTFISSQGNCALNVSNGNTAPTIQNLQSYTIPYGTAFVLKGNGYDADGHSLTYTWEQTNNQISTQPPLATNATGPNFRSRTPSASPNRYMPPLNNVVAGNLTPQWEVVPFVGRTMNFSLTVRDNGNPLGSQTASKSMSVTTSANAGPFSVTSLNSTGISWERYSQQTITWDVANTDLAPINTKFVNILLSTNNGSSFPITIASNIPNTGSAIITVPDAISNNCRIMIEAVDNIFYAVNAAKFSITTNLSQDNFGLQSFNLYPNPNKGRFTIEFESTSNNDIEAEVYDIRGRRIYSQKISNTGLIRQDIILDKVQTGTYIIKINDGYLNETRKLSIQ